MPIWVVNYAPSNFKNLFVGILLGISPLGVIFGYLFTGTMSVIYDNTNIWRIGIVV